MENKIIDKQKKLLLEKLSPTQKLYFEAIDWLFNGPRAVGRTYLICTVAMLHVLNGQDGIVIDHHPNPYWNSYIKSMIFGLADLIELKVSVKEVRNGFIISRKSEYYIDEKK